MEALTSFGGRVLQEIRTTATADAQTYRDIPINRTNYQSLATCTLLIVTLVAILGTKLLQKRNIDFIQETGIALIAGIIVGLLVKVTRNPETYNQWLMFSVDSFFIVILPVIVFFGAFCLDTDSFQKHLLPIGALAIPGTFFTSIITGFLMFFYAILGALAIAAIASYVCRKAVMQDTFTSQTGYIQSSITLGLAAISYFIAQGLNMSGIVAILFCGVFMAKLVRPVMEPSAADLTYKFLYAMSNLLETFVFGYLAISGVLVQEIWGHKSTWAFIGMAFFAIAVARFIPLVSLLNVTNIWSVEKVDSRQMAMMWWSGLRGAMSYALALKAYLYMDQHRSGKLMFAATFAIVVGTILFNGGLCGLLLKRLGLEDRFKVPEPTPLPTKKQQQLA